MLNQVVRVQGIVTRQTIVKPKINKSYHYIEETKQGYVQQYKDQYAVEGTGDNISRMFPTKDAAGNPMTPDYGYCEYQDVQKVVIQEMPERAPTGQLPRSVTVVLENDLVDKVKPGDRVEITGVYKTIANHSSKTSGVFKTVLIGTGVKNINEVASDLSLHANDIRNI